MLTGCSAQSGEPSSGEAGSAGDLLSQIQERGEIIIAMEGTWAPWTYHDENDELVGFDVEVGQQIAEALAWRLPLWRASGTACWPDWTPGAMTS